MCHNNLVKAFKAVTAAAAGIVISNSLNSVKVKSKKKLEALKRIVDAGSRTVTFVSLSHVTHQHVRYCHQISRCHCVCS